MDDVLNQRDRWDRGLVRHLRLDPDHPLDNATALRVQRDGGIGVPGGTDEIFYTLVLRPKHAGRADELRQVCERNPQLGGVFSGPRDL